MHGQHQHIQHQHQHQQPQSHYELLGVQRCASPAAVKAAYQRRLLACHPDKAGQQATQDFQALQHAWQVLRDPGSRLVYDHQLSQAELRATVVLHDEVELEGMEQQQPQFEQLSAQATIDSGTTGPSCSSSNGEGRNGGAETTRVPPPGPSYSYPCRCGDAYVLSPADLAAATATQQIILPCSSCSNHILVRLPPPAS